MELCFCLYADFILSSSVNIDEAMYDHEQLARATHSHGDK